MGTVTMGHRGQPRNDTATMPKTMSGRAKAKPKSVRQEAGVRVQGAESRMHPRPSVKTRIRENQQYGGQNFGRRRLGSDLGRRPERTGVVKGTEDGRWTTDNGANLPGRP